jgi:hypothetical protein
VHAFDDSFERKKGAPNTCVAHGALQTKIK